MAKKNWVRAATPKALRGDFRRKAEAAGETTREYAQEKKAAPGKTGKQARLAITLMSMGRKKSPLYTHSRSHKD